jgi:DNA-binding CsgD family transcriptional regulator
VESHLKNGKTTGRTKRNRDLLTPREREIVQLLAEEKSNKEIAATLGLSVHTVETHRNNIMRKLATHSLSGLIRYAVRNKIVQF